MHTIPLPAIPDVERVIHVVANHPPAFFLDSADSNARYSFAGLSPKKFFFGNDAPWEKLPFPKTVVDHPFPGGWLGYVSYENSGPIPNHWFGLFETVLVMDHKENSAHLIGPKEDLENQLQNWMNYLEEKPRFDSETSRLIHKPEFTSYEKKMARIQEYLGSGDVYQINYTERFEAITGMSGATLYHRLRTITPAPYGAFLNTGDFQILSASPECLLKIHGNEVSSFPIKGTCSRGQGSEDEVLRTRLKNSEKNRAELLMIVDLVRHDLGKVCDYGSIEVLDLFSLKSFAQVHHLTTEVRGILRKDRTSVDALKALFPGGSVTGAPKKRATEIINELEEVPRSVYTGALGYFAQNGNAQFNIPIRTLLKIGETVYFHAGGGIVIDSKPEEEFQEMWVKVSGMMEALNFK